MSNGIRIGDKLRCVATAPHGYFMGGVVTADKFYRIVNIDSNGDIVINNDDGVEMFVHPITLNCGINQFKLVEDEVVNDTEILKVYRENKEYTISALENAVKELNTGVMIADSLGHSDVVSIMEERIDSFRKSIRLIKDDNNGE